MASLTPGLTVSPATENGPNNPTHPGEAELIKLRAVWDKHMKDLTPRNRYTRVAVLLLFWDPVTSSHLNTREEITDLRDVLERQYHFKVREQSLNPISEKRTSAQKLLQKCLADFVYDEDEKNTLLIVYYAGHGNPLADGDLMLTGGNAKPQRGDKVDNVAWTQTERLIHTAEDADVLLIFDCCFAGTLCGTMEKRAYNARIFEFLGATGSNGLARLPGPESFSRALIWSLKALVNEKDGFTTSTLFSKILTAPNFPKHEQTPTLSERRGHSLKRLVLAPLNIGQGENLTLPEEDVVQLKTPSNGETPPSGPEYGRAGQRDCFPFSLTIQLDFPDLLSEEEMESMCDGFKELKKGGDLKAGQITCRDIRRPGTLIDEYPPLVMEVAYNWLRKGRKRSFSGVAKGPHTGDQHPSPQQNPSPDEPERNEEKPATSEGRDMETSLPRLPKSAKRPRLTPTRETNKPSIETVREHSP